MSDLRIANTAPPIRETGRQARLNATETSAGFGDYLQQAVVDVNRQLVQADAAAEALVTGRSQDIHNTMIAKEKADISFQLLMQVRNKVVAAYENIMRMQI
jgi:flagellar hook-basal body complex protein FliE